MLCHAQALLQVSNSLGRIKRVSGIDHHDIAPGTALPFQNLAHNRGIVSGIAAGKILYTGAGNAQFIRIDIITDYFQPIKFADKSLVRGGDFIKAVIAVHDQRAFKSRFFNT